jgi:uncharacterized membrane protein
MIEPTDSASLPCVPPSTVSNTALSRLQRSILVRIAWILAVALFFKVLGSIVFEYRNYFPANFGSNFLAGKESFFYHGYHLAFYAHIVSGPVALLIGALLMFSSKRESLHRWHRRMGKVLAYVILLVMLPSGLMMATRALTGPIAGVSFVVLTVLLSFCIVKTAMLAKRRKFAAHQVWATRTFLLLCSPLLLRLMTGATIVLDVESDWTYRLAAWGSWLIPMTVFEVWQFLKRNEPCLAFFVGEKT